MTIIFLGTGTTSGIPVYGCNCKVCREGRIFTFAKRKQSAILILCNDSALLIDAGFDVSGIVDHFQLKAVLLTHWHHDHYPGLFRLRWTKYPLKVYAPRENIDPEFLKNPLNLEFHFAKYFEHLQIGPFDVTTLKLNHEIETLGYFIKCDNATFAVLYDTKGLPMETKNFLLKKRIDLAAIDAAYAPVVEDPYHNNVDEAIKIGKEINAKKIVLTHIDHRNLPFMELLQYVKTKYDENIIVGYDGLIITLI
ncbi:MAG: MBL fold metallo-hydrolase [Candidatus Asgardarchaeia archaeon]